MDRLLPIRIEACPLIDALIEFRFEAAITKSAVFGIIYNLIKEEYRGNVINLPILQIPEQIREVDPNLKFKPLYRIENERVCPTILVVANIAKALGVTLDKLLPL